MPSRGISHEFYLFVFAIGEDDLQLFPIAHVILREYNSKVKLVSLSGMLLVDLLSLRVLSGYCKVS